MSCDNGPLKVYNTIPKKKEKRLLQKYLTYPFPVPVRKAIIDLRCF